MTRSSLILLTVLALIALAVLVGLGTWQLQRLAFKDQLIARIEARTRGAPLSLGDLLAKWQCDGDIEYLRVHVSGQFLHNMERHLYAVFEGQPGWYVLTPLELNNGTVVFVNRGFVPDKAKAQDQRRDGLTTGSQEVLGLVRVPSGQKNWFAPDNDTSRNQWFWFDLQNMTASVSNKLKVSVLPFVIEAERQDNVSRWPQGGVTRLSLPNRHFEYALTWYGIALGLIGVYAFFVRSRLRSR